MQEDFTMDTAAQERILSSLKAKGYTFDSYRDLYDYADKLDHQSYLPGDYDTLDPDEQNFMKEDEVHEVLNDVYAQRHPESTQKTVVVDSKAIEEHFNM
jgi:hypothetical protein